MRARRRRWLLLIILPLLGVAAFLSLRAPLKPERISAFLLQQAQQITGLEITLEAPADVGLLPDFHLELHGLTASAPGATQPLLRVTRVEVTLPWSMLRSDDITLLGLRLIEPRLDLPATLAFFDRGADAGPPSPLRIPTLDAPLEIRAGRIDADGWALDALNLTLPAFREGAHARLTLGGTLLRENAAEKFALQLLATPHADGPALRLAPLTLDLALDALPAWRPHITGEATWNPASALAFDLRSLIAPWPDAWPELPLPPSDDDAVNLRLNYDGDTALTGNISFSLARGDDGARGTLTLNHTLAWLGGESTTPLPPLDGSIDIPRMQYGSIEASGIRIKMQSQDSGD